MSHLTTIKKKYSIRLSRHNVQFCNIYPTTELDNIILDLLALNDGEMEFSNLGLILGFAVKEIPLDDIHYDKAEVNIFEEILEIIQRYHLITVENKDQEKRIIRTTQWGKLANSSKEKRLFYEGKIALPQHYLIKISDEQNAQFPFKKFGIHSSIFEQKECAPFEIQDRHTPEGLKHTLAKENLDDVQGENKNVEIFQIEKVTSGYNSQNLKIEISLFETSGGVEIKTAIAGEASPEMDELLQSSANQKIYQDWLQEARFSYFLESETLLTAENLEEYTNFVEWTSILKDDRTVWDDKLLNLLSKEGIATQENWTLVCEIAPQEIIIEYFDKYKKFWNWYVISGNLPTGFIVDHANDYDWDFDAILKNLETDEIESILRSIDDNDSITDWRKVTEKISSTFLQANITEFPFDLYLLSKSTDDNIRKLVIDNPNLDWDWSYIVRYWPFEFVIENYIELASKFNLKALIVRVLNNLDELEVLLDSDHVISLLQSALQSTKITFSHQDKIILNEQALDFLQKNNLLFWGYGKFSGIEANTNLYWSASIFAKYHLKVKTEEGNANVSSTIPDLDLVELNPHFAWDFNILSNRSDLNWSIEFIRDYKEKLSLEELLSHLSGAFVAENLQFFVEWLIENDSLKELSTFVSNNFSFTQIKDNSELLRTRAEEIEWRSVLRHYTQEELNKLSIELKENSLDVPFIKALWTCLAEMCKLDFILKYPEFGWDWKLITESRIEEFSLNNKEFYSKYAQYLYWPYILAELVSSVELTKNEKLISVSVAISKTPVDIRAESWRIITKKIPRNQLWQIITETESNENVNWDWDYISSMDNLPISHQFLDQYGDLLNWNLLSKNPFLNEFFRYDHAAYRNMAEWIERCLEYLYGHKDKWDFKALSLLDNLTWNDSIISKFQEKWDWETLVLKSNLLTKRNKKLNLIEFRRNRLQKYSDFIDWELLSTLFDVRISIDLINKFPSQKWDWPTLSAHPKFEITNEYLIAHKDKAWDYQALTTHSKLDLNKELLLELRDKDWDFKKISIKNWVDNDLVISFQDKNWNWAAISGNHSLIPDVNLLNIFASKEDIIWRSVVANSSLHITPATLSILVKQEQFSSTCWDVLSKHPNLDFEQHSDILDSYREFWNWSLLFDQQKVDMNELAILQEYQNYIDWEYLSQHKQFRPSEEVLSKFKEYLDWNFITSKVQLTLDLLEQYKDYLDWSYISKAEISEFTPDVIDRYNLYWDYFVLKDNVALSYASRSKVDEIIRKKPELELYFRLKQKDSNWSGYIYHFTHIQNALKILESRKILSRNKAENIADAAGTVVHRRATSHEYARFYFRPQTPTQHYNECLGIDIESNNFEKAHKLGLPKCPVPVFFKFNLQEVLLKMNNRCFISDGNMQTNWAKEAPVREMLSFFNFNDVYSTIFNTTDDNWRTYIRYSQQEFLVKDVLDFTKLNDFQIVVNSEEAKQQLSTLLKNKSISRNIVLDNPELNIFHNGNKKIDVSYNNEILNVTTNYRGDGIHCGEIHLEFHSEHKYEYLSGSIQQALESKIIAYPSISLKIPEEIPFSLYFYDDYKNDSWLIYQNGN